MASSCTWGDVDRGQIAAGHEPGQGDGVAAVGLDPIAGLARDERRGDDVAGQALEGQVAVQPVPAGAGLVDEHQLGALALKLADHGVDVALPRADGAPGYRAGGAIIARVRDGDGVLVDVETDVQCATVSHG